MDNPLDAQATESVDSLKQTIESLKKELCSVTSENDLLREEVEKYYTSEDKKAEDTNAQKQLGDLEKEKAQILAEKDGLLEKLKMAQEDRLEQTAKCERLESELSKVKKETVGLEKQLKAAKDQNEVVLMEKKSSSDLAATFQITIQQLKDQIVEKDDLIKRMMKNVETKSAYMDESIKNWETSEEKMGQILDDSFKIVEMVKNNMESTRNSLDEIIWDHVKKNMENDSRARYVQSVVNECREQNAMLQKDKEKIVLCVMRMKNVVSGLEDRVQMLTKEKDDAKMSYETLLSEKIAEIERMSGTTQTEKAKSERLEKLLIEENEKREKAEHKSEDLEYLINSFKVEGSKGKRNTMPDDLVKSTFEVKQMRERIDELEKNVTSLSKLLGEEKVKSKSVSEELSSKITRLSNVEKNVLNIETRKLLFNYVALGVKLMNTQNTNKNTNLTDFYVDMENEAVPVSEWPMWINSKIENTPFRAMRDVNKEEKGKANKTK
ncbi:synaptonemal complex protein, putative [Entamoeba invadens IP1]|uniref:Synaptonemal complex protein, putative n=1 Tax=Entamoeba invadens IP1 TaxID=370355 RepID=A0A0A1U6D4_ENTIV|nr:synaptonemal complex protein, putative [Entamoeba invadens IP1]ELP88445.1 synaptonemal complex protein, putative [Entamoeba invadens IP1]|eukprot:XP_004255216.1 synaptonemal complex protein, putative [Entamoeba invadens IP1]